MKPVVYDPSVEQGAALKHELTVGQAHLASLQLNENMHVSQNESVRNSFVLTSSQSSGQAMQVNTHVTTSISLGKGT